MTCEQESGQFQNQAAEDVDQIGDRKDHQAAAEGEKIQSPHPVTMQEEAQHGVIILIREFLPLKDVQAAEN